MSNVHTFVLAAGRKYGASEQAARAFFKKLLAEVFVFEQGVTLQELAARLWTSCSRLELASGKFLEFCSLVNRMLRERDPELLPSGCSVVRGINLLFYDPNKRLYPPSGQLHRGGALPLHHLPFFSEGKMFRVPMYLSTTFKEDEAYA